MAGLCRPRGRRAAGRCNPVTLETPVPIERSAMDGAAHEAPIRLTLLAAAAIASGRPPGGDRRRASHTHELRYAVARRSRRRGPRGAHPSGNRDGRFFEVHCRSTIAMLLRLLLCRSNP
jgi:hypothetical protein